MLAGPLGRAPNAASPTARSSFWKTAAPSAAGPSERSGRPSARRCSPPAMSGYQETLTDPSYHRQVVVATAPHIGNTGWNDEDDESGRIWVAGYVVRDAARVPSSWRSRRSLDDELQAQGMVGMCEVDTRALTRHLRERGAMRVGVSSVETDPAALLERVRAQPEMTGAFLADQVSTDRRRTSSPPHGETALPGGRGRPGHQVDDPAPDGRAGHRGARGAGHRDHRRDRRPGSRTACSSPTAPATPGPTDGPVELLRQGAWRPASRSSASASATSCSAGPWASAPTSWRTGTAASTSR